MPPATDRSSPTRPKVAGDDDFELRLRVLAEFHEMPGLRLTLTQASRLFNIEPARCGRILDMLVDGDRLAIDGTAFTTVDGGRRSA